MTNPRDLQARPQVLSLGSINADFQVRVERRPQLSETLVASDFLRLSGGKAANVAFLARKLGVEARLFAHAGTDDLARQALAPLRAMGVDLSGVRQVADANTGVAMIMVPPDAKKGIVMAVNANDAWNEADADAALQAISGAPADSVLAVDCEIPAFVAERALRAARRRGLKTILDPSPADRVTDAMLEAADMVIPDSGEAHGLTGIECKDPQSAMKAGERLCERGAAVACIKLPDGGCVVVGEGRRAWIPAVPVKVTDTTGAGDAFAGALAVAVLERRSCLEAARFAVAASHLAVTGYGSQPAFPGREDIQQMEQRLCVRTDVESQD